MQLWQNAKQKLQNSTVIQKHVGRSGNDLNVIYSE